MGRLVDKTFRHTQADFHDANTLNFFCIIHFIPQIKDSVKMALI